MSHAFARTYAGSYQGDWHEDARCGFGIQMYSDGNKYEGEWLNNKCHGKGKQLVTFNYM